MIDEALLRSAAAKSIEKHVAAVEANLVPMERHMFSDQFERKIRTQIAITSCGNNFLQNLFKKDVTKLSVEEIYIIRRYFKKFESNINSAS